MEQENELHDPVNDSVDSTISTDSTTSTGSLQIPFAGRTNTKSAVFFVQVCLTATVIGVGTGFTAAGITSTGVFLPILSGIIGYWLPNPKF